MPTRLHFKAGGKSGRDFLATNLGYGYMPVKVECCVMDIIQTLSLGVNMVSTRLGL